MSRSLGTLILIACCIATSGLYAQSVTRSADTVNKKSQVPVRYIAPLVKPKGPKPITHEFSGGVRLNSNGGSLYLNYGRLKAKNMRQIDMFHRVRFWQLEGTEKHSPKEERVAVTDVTGNSHKYKYGKVNNFYALKLGYGSRRLLVGKPEQGTVSIHWVNLLGASLGMQKPYYVNVAGDPNAIKYSDATKSSFLDQYNIVSSAGIGKGLGEMKLIPGGHFKSALHFDFSGNRKSALAVETGFNIEYYASEITLMANEAPTSYFFDVFVAIQFGKRW